MKIPGLLLMLLGIIPAAEMFIHSSDAAKYMTPAAIFWSGGVLAMLSAAIAPLKGYISTDYQKPGGTNGVFPPAAAAAVVIVAACLVFLPACVTAPDGTRVADIPRIARVTREAAEIGTRDALIAHPEWKPKFQQAAEDLAVMEGTDTVSLDQLLAIVNLLPVRELRSQNARFAVDGARILIAALDVPEIPGDKLTDLKPIVAALRDGITAGIPPP